MYAKSAVTIESILDAAAQLFIGNNYADVTISQIAKTAKVSKGALYHHFDSKEHLYVDMMLKAFQRVEKSHQQSLHHPSSSCRERMKQSLLCFLKLPEQTLKLVGLVRRDINIFEDSTRDKLIRAYQKAVPQHVEKMVQDGITAGEIAVYDARLLSWLHVAMVEVALQPYSQLLMDSHETRAEFLVKIFFEGVGSPKHE